MSLKPMATVEAYIAEHKLQDHLQACLQHVVNEMSAEPLKVMSEFLMSKHEELTKEAYEDKVTGKARWPLGEIFMQFDSDNDGSLSLIEFKRALRAIGMPKREGDKADLDEFTFKQMDTNGDGVLSVQEFDTNMPLALRAKLEQKLDAGWKFDEEKWKASQERHARWNMAKVFKKFDTDGDGVMDIDELKRAFRAIGLEKRKGEKFELDEATFKEFDTNGDGKVSLEEFEANLHPKTREAIEEKLKGDWKFDTELWAASQARHAKTNYAKIFKLFDADADGTINMRELQRAFRALGLKKRTGEKFELDKMTFDAIDVNKDGVISLEEFENNMPAPLREKLDEAVSGGWEFDETKWKASLERHAADEAYDNSKIYS